MLQYVATKDAAIPTSVVMASQDVRYSGQAVPQTV